MLSRLIGESIMISDSIKVTVVKIEGNKVRLAVEADRTIPVYRGEVWEQIKEVRKPE